MNGKTKNNNIRKNDSLINFKKSRSLLEKIIKMVQDNEYCIDIMQQNLAVIGMLRQAIIYMLKNSKNMREKARKYIENNYSWDKVYKQIEEIYSK